MRYLNVSLAGAVYVMISGLTSYSSKGHVKKL